MRKSACEALISECEELLPLIEEKVISDMIKTNNTEIIIPKIKSFLEHCRSIIDYCAQDIFQYILPERKRVEKLKSRNKHVYFPYAKDKNLFKENIEKNLPGLPIGKIYNLIEDLQDYTRSPEKRFLLQMCSLTNENKHNQLTSNQRKVHKSISIGNFIRVDGNSEITLSNCVFNGVPSGTFKIKNGNIEGNINPILLKDVIKWESGTFVFKDTNIEIVPFLNLCQTEVKSFCISLYNELDKVVPSIS